MNALASLIRSPAPFLESGFQPVSARINPAFAGRADNASAGRGLAVVESRVAAKLGQEAPGVAAQSFGHLPAVFLPAGGSADWPVNFRINSLRLVQTFLEGGGFQGSDYRIHGTFHVSDSANMPALPFDKRGQVGQGR